MRVGEVATRPGKGIPGRVAGELPLLLLLGSENAGRYEDRVHLLEDRLVGLALRLLAEFEVALHESEA